MNFDNLNFYIIVPSAIFFYCLFEGYLSVHNIKKFWSAYPLIRKALKYLVFILFTGLLLYLFSETFYVMAPQGNDLPKSEIKITGDNKNTLSINNSTIILPDSVSKGLTNLGTGAAVGAVIKAGASLVKASGLSPTAKIGVMTAGAVVGGTTVTIANAMGSIFQKKNNYSSTSSSNSGTGSEAFSIEPGPDLDTVMTLLNANYILHICILSLLISLMILYISTMAIENKFYLVFIKNIFGERFHSFLIKLLSYSAKHNKVWMIIAWIFLIFGSIVALWLSYFLIDNIDIISEIVQQSKSK